MSLVGRLSPPSARLLTALRQHVDPVVARAGFVWNDSGSSADRSGQLTAVLYEAKPVDFVARYPGTGLRESYPSDEWPPPCVDLWLTFAWDSRSTQLDVEGFDPVADLTAAGHGDVVRRATELTQDADADARAVAAALALLLDVPADA